ncbi:VanZ family protein [Paenibacillus sp. IB182496]|uniref:VanZ family protein n=1 Tax=Paenibacillus sabuli TaxID=2772509 RepID=A0A927BTT1_9BACL|nr:VanZ family protein [Paenibacillus sabuli]MBD2845545.1 VanZ family protein [Paenibacillus sabuli]
MLEPYLFPVKYAFLLFPVAALLFTLPFLIVQYRRHGYVNKLRGVLLYLFLLYMMNAFFLVLLPLPPSRHNAPPASGSYMQLTPFMFIRDILRESGIDLSRPSEYVRLLRERAVLQAVFNVLLTVPFGIFMRYYFHWPWFGCFAASAGLALLFEVTQVTGIYGYYDYPYRLFDVDDLMLNTLGGMVGFLLAALVLSRFLPRIDRLDDALDLTVKRVSYTRRLIAFGVDACAALAMLVVCAILGQALAGGLVAAGYMVLAPYATNGRSLGRALVRIRIVGAGERLTFREAALRGGLLYGWFGLNMAMAGQLGDAIPGLLLVPAALALLVLDVLVFIHVMRCLFNHRRRLWHERASGTAYRITGASQRQPRSAPSPADPG